MKPGAKFIEDLVDRVNSWDEGIALAFMIFVGGSGILGWIYLVSVVSSVTAPPKKTVAEQLQGQAPPPQSYALHPIAPYYPYNMNGPAGSVYGQPVQTAPINTYQVNTPIAVDPSWRFGRPRPGSGGYFDTSTDSAGQAVAATGKAF